MREKSKNNNYHTVLAYTELHEKNKAFYESYLALSSEEKTEQRTNRLSFSNCFKSFEEIGTNKEYYHDIVTDNGKPDYRTIEILCFMDWMGETDKEDFVIYNGYKVKILGRDFAENIIFVGLLIGLGANLNSHLLCFFVTNAYQEEFPVIKSSYIELQEFFNETEENIKHALVSLQNLNLITFSEENNGDIVINLNRNNIVKLDEKYNNYSKIEKDIAINNHCKERLTKIPLCSHCLKELSAQDIEYIVENYDEY
jgi:hypothetical protein